MKMRIFIALLSSLCLLMPNAVATVHYVVNDNPGAESPYVSWAKAAATIQDAVDVAGVGDTVMVSNGVYSTGGRPAGGQVLTNRVAITTAITVASVNGPSVTLIKGQAGSGFGFWANAVRCVFMTTNAVLRGFTITNGYTHNLLGPNACGGGIYGANSYENQTNCLVENCIITGNSCYDSGGGAYLCTLSNCIVSGNTCYDGPAYGGGAYMSTLYNCMLLNNKAYGGGGASASTLYGCTLVGNRCDGDGGGTYNSTSYNCAYMSNAVTYWGGGACFGSHYNCVFQDNTTYGFGGGARGCYLYNCTLTHNVNYYGESGRDGGGTYDCFC